MNIVDISRKPCERNGIATIEDNDGILWLNEKQEKDQIINNCEKLQQDVIQTVENIDMKYKPKKNLIEFLQTKNQQSQ